MVNIKSKSCGSGDTEGPKIIQGCRYNYQAVPPVETVPLRKYHGINS